LVDLVLRRSFREGGSVRVERENHRFWVAMVSGRIIEVDSNPSPAAAGSPNLWLEPEPESHLNRGEWVTFGTAGVEVGFLRESPLGFFVLEQSSGKTLQTDILANSLSGRILFPILGREVWVSVLQSDKVVHVAEIALFDPRPQARLVLQRFRGEVGFSVRIFGGHLTHPSAREDLSRWANPMRVAEMYGCPVEDWAGIGSGRIEELVGEKLSVC
jgi:hypothetical protein